MFTRDLERLARSLVAQNLDQEYIRYYLIETYRLDDKIIDLVFERVGIKDSKNAAPKGKSGARPAVADKMAERRNRQGF